VLSPKKGEDLLLHEWGAGGIDVGAYPIAWMARTPRRTWMVLASAAAINPTRDTTKQTI
jgi:hypothetical protein